MNRNSGNDEFARKDMRGNDRRSGGIRDRSPLNNRNRNSRNDCRVFVSNLPYEYRWQELKDLFRREIGEVAFVELFNDENDRSKGCGIVEFDNPESVKKALQNLHRADVDGRKIIVKEDFGAPRDKYGNIIRNRDRVNEDTRMPVIPRETGNKSYDWGDTYGLSRSFLEGLGITPPLVCRIFVASLDYKVTEKKLREVFKLAGRVRDVELSFDSDGKSRGFAVVEYDHPVECVQAISMLNNQQLYDRRMTVRMDRVDPQENNRLPEGLHSIGMGLGLNGAPLKDVTRNLPNGSAAPLPSQSSLSNLTAAAALTASNPLTAISGLGPSAALQAALAPAGGGLLASNLDILAGRGDSLSRDLALSNLAGFGSGLMGNTSSGLPPIDSRDGYNDRGSGRNTNQELKSSDTVIIDNLPHTFTWQSLKDKFRGAGEIKYAEMRGKIGLVRFATDWEALRAVSLLDRSRVEGQNISVRLL